MTTQEFIEWCAREIEKRKWFESGKVAAEGLLTIQKERDKMVRERDAAIKARDTALAGIQQKEDKAAQAAERDKAALAEALAAMRREADQKLQAAQAELVQVQGQIEWHKAELQRAKHELETYRMVKADEERALSERNRLLRATQTELEERVAAVLKK